LDPVGENPKGADDFSSLQEMMFIRQMNCAEVHPEVIHDAQIA
jgi:hypothetical protein